ncbi:MAG: hypothetical protein IJA94_01795 [Bacilli bacterium]|nr:hypothetical protein [Bacilli bacterium]
MKKKLGLFCIILISIFITTGCSSSKFYVFNVDTGDAVKLKLDTSNGYDISNDLPFVISQNEETLCQGTFIYSSGYDQYIDVIKNDQKAEIVETNSINGITYTFYTYNNEEFNYVIKIDNSNTGVLIGNIISEKSARECFDRLTITVE